MRKLAFIAVVAILAACGSKDAEEKIELKTFKDKLSYSLGAEQAKMITEAGDPNLDRLDFEEIVVGFNSNLSAKEAVDADCRNTLTKLYGPYGQDFDTAYVKKGSHCIGRIAGSVFYTGWNKKGVLDQIDMEMAKVGFRHAILKKDTLIDKQLSMKMMKDFLVSINKKNGDKMMAAGKKRPNTRVIDGGIILETIQEGTGGSPTATDDISANYILTSAEGDTVESSFNYKIQNGTDLPAMNLGEVIQGWTMAFQQMKKGGKYRIFVPWNLAYGEQRNCESLTFYVELNDFGPKGSLKKEMPQPEMQIQ
jgi:FKBP-type peptidyl-prolyl cis-trans isomerase|tara:strand:+ start:10699 stop:11622 length:924 start_codon:yes stop_codon:yes gene_type:complete